MAHRADQFIRTAVDQNRSAFRRYIVSDRLAVDDLQTADGLTSPGAVVEHDHGLHALLYDAQRQPIAMRSALDLRGHLILALGFIRNLQSSVVVERRYQSPALEAPISGDGVALGVDQFKQVDRPALLHRVCREHLRALSRQPLANLDLAELNDGLRVVLLQGEMAHAEMTPDVNKSGRGLPVDFDGQTIVGRDQFQNEPLVRRHGRVGDRKRDAIRRIQAARLVHVGVRGVDLSFVSVGPLRVIGREERTEPRTAKDAAVASLVDASFHAQMEIRVVAPLGIKVARRRPRPDQHALFYPPISRLAGVRFPTAQVLAVEQRNKTFRQRNRRLIRLRRLLLRVR